MRKAAKSLGKVWKIYKNWQTKSLHYRKLHLIGSDFIDFRKYKYVYTNLLIVSLIWTAKVMEDIFVNFCEYIMQFKRKFRIMLRSKGNDQCQAGWWSFRFLLLYEAATTVMHSIIAGSFWRPYSVQICRCVRTRITWQWIT